MDNRKELLTKAKPIRFDTEMVGAILDGRKTVTRRVVKPQPIVLNSLVIPPYKVGNILYVRETWQYAYDLDGNEQPIEETGRYLYAADNLPEPFVFWVNPDGTHSDRMPWHPSIHMPKEAARIFLKVTNVRVERLQDICGGDLLKEGIDLYQSNFVRVAFDEFTSLWNSTVKKKDLGKYGWDANPWVWVIEFERMD